MYENRIGSVWSAIRAEKFKGHFIISETPLANAEKQIIAAENDILFTLGISFRFLNLISRITRQKSYLKAKVEQ